jgi:hypothetical protein
MTEVIRCLGVVTVRAVLQSVTARLLRCYTVVSVRWMNRRRLYCAGTSHMYTILRQTDWLCDRQPAIGRVRGQHLLGFANEHSHSERDVSVHVTSRTVGMILVTLEPYNLHTLSNWLCLARKLHEWFPAHRRLGIP